MQKEYLSAAAEVLSDQGVDENLGLSDDEASSRLAKTGPNKLEEAEKTPLWKRFFEQMADPMVIMLIVAAVISALTGMVKGEADFADVAIIMFVVIVNSVLGVVQEAKSEEALEALQEMSAARSYGRDRSVYARSLGHRLLYAVRVRDGPAGPSGSCSTPSWVPVPAPPASPAICWATPPR